MALLGALNVNHALVADCFAAGEPPIVDVRIADVTIQVFQYLPPETKQTKLRTEYSKSTAQPEKLLKLLENQSPEFIFLPLVQPKW
jgi:hypothetical protein